MSRKAIITEIHDNLRKQAHMVESSIRTLKEEVDILRSETDKQIANLKRLRRMAFLLQLLVDTPDANNTIPRRHEYTKPAKPTMTRSNSTHSLRGSVKSLRFKD
jgi:hypothetical protein